MKPKTSAPFFFATLIAALMIALTSQATAQTFTTLHTFAGGSAGNPNLGGAFPACAPTLSGNRLYGTASDGGSGGNGTVFALNTDGTGFQVLHNFTSGSGSTNSDGWQPQITPLILSGGILYGTAVAGGSSGFGTVFAVHIDGTGFRTLYSFSNSGDGAYPDGGLVLSGDTLYGTTRAFASFGSSGNGTVFALSTNGSGFSTLYSFTGGSDGFFPQGLLLSGNTLYGTTYGGWSPVGLYSSGTVFAINPDGTGFSTLYSFTAQDFSSSPPTNSDGAFPNAGLTLSGNTLFGTAGVGGRWGSGTVFTIKTDGTGFTTLYTFSATPGPNYSNSDGTGPNTGLPLSGNTLYGTASEGGPTGSGTLFAINTDGTGFTNLHNFSGITGGENPSGLILSGSALYGTTEPNGDVGGGTVFKFSLSASAPQLTITAGGANVILSWPTNATGFILQSISNLGPPALWTAVSSDPVVVKGQNTVTNPISGVQQFYRLSQ